MGTRITRNLFKITANMVALKFGCMKYSITDTNHAIKELAGSNGTLNLFRWSKAREYSVSFRPACQNSMAPSFARSTASTSSGHPIEDQPVHKNEISNIEDPFNSPTYNIPEKPVTFVEGASYTVVILAGLGVAAVAGYAVIKELIFQPKEYKIYGKALTRVQNDSQVRVRIGSPITGYGQETRNRSARQRISNRIWTDEEGVEHVEVHFYVRGPHGGGKVFAEMFKDQKNQWTFTFLIVEIKSPSPAQLMLESYVPA